MRSISLSDFHSELKAQGVKREDLAFRCPVCRTIQSARDLIAAGAGGSFDEVEKYIGFSCVGRFTNAGPARKVPDGKPCDWSLGGLLRLHDLAVMTDAGERPTFEPVSPDEAQAHARKYGEG